MRRRIAIAVSILLVSWVGLSAQSYAPLPDGAHGLASGLCKDDIIEGDEYRFDICIGRKKIGEYQTYRIQGEDLVLYCARSHVRIWIFGRIDVHYSLECAFADNSLLYSTCIGLRNGKEYLRSEVIRNGSTWLVTHNGDTWVEHRPVVSSLIDIYYRVPEIGDFALIESTAVMKQIFDNSGDIYYMKEPGKRGVSELMYRDGLIQRVNVHFPLLNFSVVRQTPGLPDCVCEVDVVQ